MQIRRLSTRLALWLLPATAAILLGAVWWQFDQARGVVIRNGQTQADLLSRLAGAELHRLLDPAQASTDVVASQLPNVDLAEERIRAFIVEFLRRTPNAYGSTIALEPGALGTGSPRIAPYFHKRGDDFQFVDLTHNDFTEAAWYRVPRETETALWSAPYFDTGGGEVLMITYSVPFTRMIEGERRFGGVITADVKLDRLDATLRDAIKGLDGFELTIIGPDGLEIAHSDPRWDFDERIALELKRTERLSGAVDTPSSGMETLYAYRSRFLDADALAFVRTLDIQGWRIVLGIDRDTALADARRARDRIIAATGVGLATMIVIILLVTARVTRPVALLARTTRTIAGGELDFEIPEPEGHDEIAGLQSDFLHMRDALRENIAKLEEETRARQKLESELEIAREIQLGLLPSLKSLGSLRGFEIATSLQPAKMVGGDLYNYFYVDDEDKAVLCFAVGDVSDKGVPAALFMARTNTLVRPATRYFKTPEAVLSWLSLELTRENRNCMFVTLLCCAIELDTGAVSLANASHLAPLIVRHDGSVELKEIAFGPPLGVMKGAAYPTGDLTLEVGDSIILYSDGVTEAMNEAGEQYGEERLLELARSLAGKAPEEMTTAIVDDVREHAGAAPQSDDITVLVLRRTPVGAAHA